MDFINIFLENIYQYAETHTFAPPQYLLDLERETHLKTLSPRMLSGVMQGRVLSFLSKILQPNYILEIGTFTGYSALCLAEGLREGGKLHTIEVNEEMSFLIEKYIENANFQDKIQTHYGDAKAIIPNLELVFDMVFIDADKKNNLTYFDLTFPKVRQGGLILIDNVLWSGKVAQPSAQHDRDTAKIDAMNKQLLADERIEILLLPLRDGLTICRKK